MAEMPKFEIAVTEHDLRTRAALAALTGLLANREAFGPSLQGSAELLAGFAVTVADALVARIRKDEVPE